MQHTEVDGQMLGKTKLCKFFVEGHCSRGRACNFAHGRKELREQPILFKTEMCFDFTNYGTCRRGAACQYAHGRCELREMAAAPLAPAKAARPLTEGRVQAVNKPRSPVQTPSQSTSCCWAEAPQTISHEPSDGYLGHLSQSKRIRKDASRFSSLQSTVVESRVSPTRSSTSDVASEFDCDEVAAMCLPATASDPCVAEVTEAASVYSDWDEFLFAGVGDVDGASSAASATMDEVPDFEMAYDTQLRVRSTFLTLLPFDAPPAARRSRSVPVHV